MTSPEILQYFDATEHRPTRPDLIQAVELVLENPSLSKVAIDCGCGAGSDIAYLRQHNFQVNAFDIEREAIERCGQRFEHDNYVALTQTTFKDFSYPQASLVVADASLFFCPQDEFKTVWQKIGEALLSGGVFTGSFLGAEDTMAGPNYNKDAYWFDVLVTNEIEIKTWFKEYLIESFTEHKSSGVTPGGEHHQWHIYSVVATKK